MKQQKIYEEDDRMISLIKDDYNLLQSVCRFGISLGFGDKTVREVCEDNGVDCHTFLTVINFAINGFRSFEVDDNISIPTLLHYLKSSHEYFIGFHLPSIRRELEDGLEPDNHLSGLILRFYDEYAKEISKHMIFEEKTVFPYVERLLGGETLEDSHVRLFSKHHGQVEQKLSELKNIILKYLPSNSMNNNKLMAALYDIYLNEEWINAHVEVEDNIFLPAIKRLEDRLSHDDVTKKISSMIHQGDDIDAELLSNREKDVVICIVQGMTNKEIADHLFISINTVITHRRNIARKLQIHSTAGLTIYAIVNNLVDINALNL